MRKVASPTWRSTPAAGLGGSSTYFATGLRRSRTVQCLVVASVPEPVAAGRRGCLCWRIGGDAVLGWLVRVRVEDGVIGDGESAVVADAAQVGDADGDVEGVRRGCDSDDGGDSRGAGCSDARRRVLEHGALLRRPAESSGAQQVGRVSGFPAATSSPVIRVAGIGSPAAARRAAAIARLPEVINAHVPAGLVVSRSFAPGIAGTSVAWASSVRMRSAAASSTASGSTSSATVSATRRPCSVSR